ncbi:MAG: isochorismate synthase [Microbacteriaceae bacterium]
MPASATTVPVLPAIALNVETIPLPNPGRLIPFLDAAAPLLWMRNGDGIAGIGTALRMEFTGESRILDAAAAWRDVVAGATVHDPIGLPGSGLAAFGAFSFSASSAASSVLIVPKTIIGRRGGTSWLTRITVADRAAERAANNETVPTGPGRGAGKTSRPEAAMPRPRPLGDEYRIHLRPGALDPAGYRSIVARAIDRIDSGQVSKVVLARDLVGHLPRECDLRRVLADLAVGYPACWTYSVDGLIGASPETLVRVAHGSMDARVLAGTISRGSDAGDDHDAANTLLNSGKDQQEHHFAVQSVLDALRPHCAKLTASPAPFTLKLPNLWHLATDVAGTLDDGSTSLDLVNALHPTAAVAGTPTPEAIALIEELEPFDRGRYAGPVGWIGADGDGEWAVALRSAQVCGNGDIGAFAGCGIVAGSDPERELTETAMKFRPVVEAFG